MMNPLSIIFVILFWACAALVAHTYVVYPLLAWFISRLRGAPGTPASVPDTPTVSLLIVAHNEQEVIEQRLVNALSLDFPRDRLEIVVASDGSSDSTAEIVRRFADRGVRLIDFQPQRGKAGVLNRAIPQLTTDIVALSDANTQLDVAALRNLVGWFGDPEVGVVCGRLILTDLKTGQNADGLYWRYETLIKQCEARLDALLGANGAIYAIRRSVYVPLPDRMIVEDFVIPLLARLHHGCAIRYDVNAIAREPSAANLREEFRRRSRIGVGNFQSIGLLWRLLDPRRGFVAFAFFSHKLLRWFCPFFLIGLLIAGASLVDRPFYRIALITQIVCYAIAGLALLAPSGVPLPKFVRLIAMFAAMNAALFVGFLRWLTGTEQRGWRPTSRTADSANIAGTRPQI